MVGSVSATLDAIHDEFVVELSGVREFAAPANVADARRLSSRARVAASNGATLLLAALFEECVRQMIKAGFNYRRRTRQRQESFPDSLPAQMWRRSLEMLARKPFEDLRSNHADVDRQMRAIVSFCMKGNLGSDLSSAISHNENNMRPNELSRLFKQIGISDIFGKLGACENVQEFYGVSVAGVAAENARTTLEDFFQRRNEIAHAIQIGSSGGPASLIRDVEFFDMMARGFVSVMTRELS